MLASTDPTQDFTFQDVTLCALGTTTTIKLDKN